MDISATPRLAVPASATADVDVSRSVLSFEVFYNDRVGEIARALAVTLGDRELAADATNEAMVRAYQRWSRIAHYDNPSAWVYRVALNWSLSWKRRRMRERQRPIELHDPDVGLATRDDSFDAALDALSVDHRAVVVCRIHLDWSVKQTAEALGIAPGTVKSRLARALDQLKEALGPMEGPGT